MVLDFNTFHPLPQWEKVFEEFLHPRFGEDRRVGYPPLNLSNDEENIYVQAVIPGVKMEDVDLTLTDKTLVIKGERPGLEGRFYRQERPVGVFHRVVALNVAVDRDRVKATMKDGVLTVVLPKAQECKPKRIAIDSE